MGKKVQAGVGIKLRFEIFKRDNFTCRLICVEKW